MSSLPCADATSKSPSARSSSSQPSPVRQRKSARQSSKQDTDAPVSKQVVNGQRAGEHSPSPKKGTPTWLGFRSPFAFGNKACLCTSFSCNELRRRILIISGPVYLIGSLLYKQPKMKYFGVYVMFLLHKAILCIFQYISKYGAL